MLTPLAGPRAEATIEAASRTPVIDPPRMHRAPPRPRVGGNVRPSENAHGPARRSMRDVRRLRAGLEGVIAFETEIAEPDKEGGALRYRGVDIEDLVGQVSFGNVWGLLVDGKFGPGPAARRAVPDPGALRRRPRRRAVRAGHARPDLGLRPLLDIEPRRPATTWPAPPSWPCPTSRSPPAASACPRCRRSGIDEAADHRRALHDPLARRARPPARQAVDAYWTSAAEHGMNASTFTARVIASTGADVAASLSGAVGAMSGPLHGGRPPGSCT